MACSFWIEPAAEPAMPALQKSLTLHEKSLMFA
jgi:hypothetical protein